MVNLGSIPSGSTNVGLYTWPTRRSCNLYIAQKDRVMFTRFAKCDLRPKILKKKHRRRSGGYVTEGYILRNAHSAPTISTLIFMDKMSATLWRWRCMWCMDERSATRATIVVLDCANVQLVVVLSSQELGSLRREQKRTQKTKKHVVQRSEHWNINPEVASSNLAVLPPFYILQEKVSLSDY